MYYLNNCIIKIISSKDENSEKVENKENEKDSEIDKEKTGKPDNVTKEKDIVNVKIEEDIENSKNKLVISDTEKDKSETTTNNINNNTTSEIKTSNNTLTPSIIELDSSNLFYCINGTLPNNNVNTDLIYGPPRVDDENAYIDVTEPDRIIPINQIITKKRKFVDDAGWNKYGYELYDEADYEQAKTLPHNQRYDSTSLISRKYREVIIYTILVFVVFFFFFFI